MPTDARQDLWRLRLPFGAIDVGFDSGALRWGLNEVTAPDHVVDIDDAAEFTQTLPYRRRSITDPTTALLAAGVPRPLIRSRGPWLGSARRQEHGDAPHSGSAVTKLRYFAGV